jgi:hypothetical protein
VKVTTNDDDTIDVSSLHGLADQPLRWREIEPFVWREVGGRTLLAAKLENGRLARFSVNGFSPFTVFEPVPWWRSAAWLLPLLVISVAALTLTALAWPAAALIRRRCGALLNLAGTDLKAYRLSRIAAASVAITLTAWVVTLARVLSNLRLLSPDLDWWFWVLQLLSVVVFPATAGVSVWSLHVVWAAKRGWCARGWSIALVVSCITVVWAALVFKLIGFTVNY